MSNCKSCGNYISGRFLKKNLGNRRERKVMMINFDFCVKVTNIVIFNSHVNEFPKFLQFDLSLYTIRLYVQ